MPEVLYKYTNTETAKLILQTSTLRWSSPLLFNDPFDVRREFSFGFDFNSLLDEVVECYLHTNINELPPMLLHIRTSIPTDQQRHVFLKLAREQIQSIQNTLLTHDRNDYQPRLREARILCLAENFDQPLLWSHYGDSHRGVVLGFGEGDKESPWKVAKKINYCNLNDCVQSRQDWVRTVCTLKTMPDVQSVSNALFFTKSLDWSYENEWRLVHKRNPKEDPNILYSDRNFIPPELKSIHFGCSISSADQKAIEDACSTFGFSPQMYRGHIRRYSVCPDFEDLGEVH